MRLGYTWTGLVAGLAILCGAASAQAGPISSFAGLGSGDSSTPTINFLNFDGGESGSAGGSAHDFSYLGGLGYGSTTSASFETLFPGKNPFEVYDVWSSGHGSLLQYGGSGVFTWAGFDGGPGSFSVPGDHDGPRGTDVAPVPEPGSLLLMGSGALLGLGRLRQRFRRTT
jgi:hypothetical protein